VSVENHGVFVLGR